MENSKKLEILKNHYINTLVINGVLFAEDESCLNGISYTKQVDVSNWDKKELYSWLGY